MRICKFAFRFKITTNMSKLIEKTEKAINNLTTAYLISGTDKITTGIFSKTETAYIKKLHEKEEQNSFSFNRLTHWEYVIILSEKTDFQNTEKCRKEGDSFVSGLNKIKVEEVILSGESLNPSLVMAFAEGMALGNYQFLKYKTEKSTLKNANSLKKISILSKKITSKEIDTINILVDAVYQTRDMVNEPVSYLNAEKLAETTDIMCSAVGAKVEILNKKKIEALKMGGLLAVNLGSIDPPTFTIIEWKPSTAKNKKPFVFVGKGIVYDTGGINIKGYPHMDTMKCDMSGGATVAGLMYAVAKAKLPLHVIGLIPATDNRPCGNAYVPGDVITMHSGLKVEVLNSDAEGRMILADALSFAKKYKPELVIDLATLTGSANAAIGKYALVAMGAKYKSYMDEVKTSGNNVYERIVEFPLWDEYKDLIKSEVADIKNIGGAYAGAITAGKFLECFTDYPWIHFDIAGPAFMDSRDSYRGQGGTGFGLRLLFDFLKRQIKK
jgi:leucyl aminopeptidase